MKIKLPLILCILSLPSISIAQKTKPAPARAVTGQALSIKDLEVVLTGNDNVKNYLAGRGFTMKTSLDQESNNEDTVVTINTKGDKVLLIYAYQRISGVRFETSTSSTAKKIVGTAGSRYQLDDSVELAKASGGVSYLQKRYAYRIKSDERFVFSFIDPSVENGRKQYVIHLRQKKYPENGYSSVVLPNPSNQPVKISAMEYDRFQSDSMKVYRYTNPTSINPIAPGLLSRMNTFILQQLFKDQYLPIQFLHNSDVKSILISPDNEQERSFEYHFNTAGQITGISLSRQVPAEKPDWDSFMPFDNEDYKLISISPVEQEKFGFDTRRHLIEYQQTVPVKVGNVTLDYNMDTVIAYSDTWIRVFKMVNKTFFLIEEYNVTPESYRKKDLSKGKQFRLEEKEGKVYYSCYDRNTDRTDFNRCYSNTNWELPFTIMEFNKRQTSYTVPFESYQEKQPGQLIRETRERGNLTYYLEKFQLKTLTNGKVVYKYFDSGQR